MQHPSEKLFRLQFLMLGLALVCGIIYFIETSFSFLLLMLFYFIALSLIFEGLAYQSKGQMPIFINQIIRAIFILLFATVLYF